MENRSLHCASVRPTTQDSMKANSPMDSNAKMMKKKHKGTSNNGDFVVGSPATVA